MTSGLKRRVGALTRVTNLDRHDLAEVARAQWELLRARLALGVARRGQLLATASRQADDTPADAQRLARAQRVSLAVDRAADYGLFRPTCLVRSLALQRMLHRAHVSGGVVRIGVRRKGEKLEAHAWIELDGEVVGERPEHAATFTPLHDFTAMGA